MSGVATAIAGSAVVGSLISANASNKAANTQANAASEAQANQLAMAQTAITAQQDILNKQLQAQQGVMDSQLRTQFDALQKQQEALTTAYNNQINIAAQTRDEQLALAKGVLDNQVGTYKPYNEAGLAGQNRLLEYLGVGGNTGATDYGKYATADFTPADFAANKDPGYAFRLSEGLKGLDRQAAARRGIISGHALKAASGFAGDQASQEYQAAYNRYQTSRSGTLSPLQSLQGVGLNAANGISNAYSEYGTRGVGAIGGYGSAAGGAAGTYGNNLANTSGTYGSNVSNIYGQQGTQQQQAYGNYINGLTGALTGYGNNATNLATSGANATASGYVGQANAVNNGISGISNAYYQNQMLGLLKDRQTGGLSDAQANQLMGSYPSINSSGLGG